MSIANNYVVVERSGFDKGVDISNAYGPFSYGEARAVAEAIKDADKYPGDSIVDIVQMKLPAPPLTTHKETEC